MKRHHIYLWLAVLLCMGIPGRLSARNISGTVADDLCEPMIGATVLRE